MECDFEIIFVNDGSRDNSRKILNDLAMHDPRVKVLHFARKFGQTAAMMAGFDFATGDIIVPMDADLQNDPEDIPRLIDKIEEGFDLCSGWRNKRQDSPCLLLPRCLAVPNIKFVFSDVGKPCSFSAIVKMAEPKILLNNVSNF